MPNAVKFALIGVGGFGGRWVDALAGCRQAKTVALVDVNPANLVAAGEKLGLSAQKQFGSLDKALAVGFDAAVVCTPPASRKPIYEALAKAGKHILTEKPLAETPADARTAVALKKRFGIHFVVSQNYRYQAAVQTLKRLLSDGTYGKPGACQVDFFKYPRFHGFREQMPYPLIIDMSIHHFDMARFLLGADPLSVVGKSWNGPWSVMKGDAAGTLVFEMSGGVHFAYNSSWTTLRPAEHQTDWNATWYVECERGCIVMKDSKITAWPWRLDDNGMPSWGAGETIDVGEFAGDQPYVLNQFIAQLRGGPTCQTTVEDNIKSMAMVFAAVEAFKKRTGIDVAAMTK